MVSYAANSASTVLCRKPFFARCRACTCRVKCASVSRRSRQLEPTQAVYTGEVKVVAAANTATVAPAEAAQSLKPEDVWQTFTRNIAGEWEGVTATFGPDGHPQELPEDAVPKEYRDWEVTLYDWQSQCSMLPTSSGITCLTKRIMPTVGCEADAQTFLEERRTLFETPSVNVTQRPVLQDGTYSTSSCTSLPEAQTLRCEHCIMLGKQHRVRLIQHLTSANATGPWQQSSVELHHEHYDQPYNAGAQLSGCGGGMTNIAEQDKLDTARLQQEWKLESGSCYDLSISSPTEATKASHRISSSKLEGVVCLPLNAYCLVQSASHNELLVEGGVLSHDGMKLVCHQSYSNGGLQTVSLGVEFRAN